MSACDFWSCSPSHPLSVFESASASWNISNGARNADFSDAYVGFASVAGVGGTSVVAIGTDAAGGERPAVEIELTLRRWCMCVAEEGPAAAVRAMLSRVGVGGTRPAVIRWMPCPGPGIGGRLGSAMLGKRLDGPP